MLLWIKVENFHTETEFIFTDTPNQALAEEMEALLRPLEELQEWCSEQGCRGSRETAMTCIWRWVLRLRHCTQELTTRSKQRIREWSDISDSVSLHRHVF